jgi:hypothetical protein
MEKVQNNIIYVLLVYGKLFRILYTLYTQMLLIPHTKELDTETKDRSLNDNHLNNFLQCKKTDHHMLKTQTKINWYGNLHLFHHTA